MRNAPTRPTGFRYIPVGEELIAISRAIMRLNNRTMAELSAEADAIDDIASALADLAIKARAALSIGDTK